MNYAYYDLAKNPPSFNFLDFLLQAEKWRIDNNLDRLKVIVLPGPMNGFRKDNLPPTGPVERTKWLNNIVLPMSRLLPSCGEEAVLGTKQHGNSFGIDQYLIGFAGLVRSAGSNLYPFRAPDDEVDLAGEKHGDNYVTITIRNTGWWVDRTSNLKEWVQVARGLEKMGFEVVFIPDGTNPDLVIEGFNTDREAALNSVKRAALYQAAEMNFGIPCGPMWLCWFLGAPTMIFKLVNENEPSTREASYTRSGLKIGSQMPNSKRHQKLVWRPENAIIILSELEALLAHEPSERHMATG